jgi:hypothetical protein
MLVLMVLWHIAKLQAYNVSRHQVVMFDLECFSVFLGNTLSHRAAPNVLALCGSMLFKLNHLLPFLLVNWRKVFLNDIVLPVLNCSISFVFLGSVVMVLDIHSSVIGVVTNLELVECLSKCILLDTKTITHFINDLRFIQFILQVLLLSGDEVVHDYFALQCIQDFGLFSGNRANP